MYVYMYIYIQLYILIIIHSLDQLSTKPTAYMPLIDWETRGDFVSEKTAHLNWSSVSC